MSAFGQVTIQDAAPIFHRAATKLANVSILEFFDKLSWTKNAAPWTAWRAFLAAIFALPMSEEERKIYDRCTGGRRPPEEQVTEAYAIVGRRGRKSAIAAVIGAYLGAYRSYGKHLAPGENARALVMSKDKDEAGQIYGFTKAIFSEPMLHHLLLKEPNAEELVLTNQVEYKIKAATLAGGRSRALFFAGLDEFAFWPQKESATPAEDIVKGIRPAMANIPKSMLLGLSTRYSKKGMLYDQYSEHYGEESPVFIWAADTLTMHDCATVRVFIAAEMRKDQVAAETEYGDKWRTDVRTFISPEAVNAVVVSGRREIPPPQRKPEEPKDNYFCFVDTSGGSADAYTAAVAHWDHEQRKAILDCLRGFEPDPETGAFSTTAATKEHATTVKSYGVTFVTGDHYAGNWPRERWQDEKMQYEVTKRDKTKIYRDALPILTARECELLDHPLLIGQLKNLERRESPKGMPTITHPPGGHDDYANAACGAVSLAYEYGKNLKQIPGEKRYKDTHDLQAEREREMIEDMTRREPRQEYPFSSMWNSDE